MFGIFRSVMAESDERHPRSMQTKLRILHAAQRRFTQEGYERTTIRAVAVDADIDPSMVMRYFGSKEGLFAAAASFDLKLPDLALLPRKDRGKRLAQHYVWLWQRDATAGGLAILLRTAATNDDAAARMREIFRDQVMPIIAPVVPDAPSIRAVLIGSQLLGIAYCRYVIRMPALVKLDDGIIVSSLGRTIQRYLDGPLDPD
jgi:AcrR family transcriptional regulator